MENIASFDHLAAVGFTVIVAVGLSIGARVFPGRWTTWVSRVIGTILIANEVWYVTQLQLTGQFTFSHSLPLYLCDVAAFLAGVSLWWPHHRLVEITYFWALAGTLQGLLTPDMYPAFPTYGYMQYYTDHCGVVITGIFLVAGLQHTPRRGAVIRVFITTALFTAFVGVCDVITGGNYMYLRQVPGNGSLLSYMGPWPWYIVSGIGVALVALTILDAPFWRGRRRTASIITEHPPTVRTAVTA